MERDIRINDVGDMLVELMELTFKMYTILIEPKYRYIQNPSATIDNQQLVEDAQRMEEIATIVKKYIQERA